MLAGALCASALAIGCKSVASRPAERGASGSPATAARPVVIGYSTPWGDAYYPPSAYDYAVYTHLLRSFLEPHADGSVSAPDSFWNADLERGAKPRGVHLLAS